jgi:hypothetical protein
VVYIQEAHPVDAWQIPSNERDNVLHADPTTTDERVDLAGICVRNLGIELPAIVDEADNRVEQAYTGWPDRLYVVDRAGRIAYKSAPGPFGFKPADMAEALQRVLSEQAGTGPESRDPAPPGD